MATQHIPGQVRRTPAVRPVFQPEQKRGFSRSIDRTGDFLLNYWAHIVTVVLGILCTGCTLCPISLVLWPGCDLQTYLLLFALFLRPDPVTFLLHLRPSTRILCTQLLYLYVDVSRQPGICAQQKTPARHPLVDLALNDCTYGLGRPDTDVWPARERLDTAHHHRHTIWTGQYLVRPTTHAEKPA